MKFDILTIFPEMFNSYMNESLFKRARKNKLIEIKVHDVRAFTNDKHQKVDDRPFGGGPGMVMKVEPIYKALQKIKKGKGKTRVILFSLRGAKLDEKKVAQLAKYDRLIMICGRYEGVDERVAEHLADEEISIGDYVLAGGELPAMVTMEAVSRYLPGFLGKLESLETIKGSYKAYTRPEVFKAGTKKWKVPDVLLSGNHKDIERWRGQS